MIVRATNKSAIELAEYSPTLQCLVMLGTEGLATYLPETDKRYLRSSEHSFVAVYGLDSHFYYKIERFSNGDACVFEVGVGLVKETEGKIVLDRTHPMFYKYKDEAPRVLNIGDTLPPWYTHPEDYIVISSYVPHSLCEALPSEHTVIASSAPHCPQPVYISQNSVLARKDEDIQSLSIYDLPAVAPSFASTDDAPKVKGSIIFDDEWSVLKYYNGKDWIQLG